MSSTNASDRGKRQPVLDRRAFLAGTGALTLAAVNPQTLRAREPAPRKYRVAG